MYISQLDRCLLMAYLFVYKLDYRYLSRSLLLQFVIHHNMYHEFTMHHIVFTCLKFKVRDQTEQMQTYTTSILRRFNSCKCCRFWRTDNSLNIWGFFFSILALFCCQDSFTGYAPQFKFGKNLKTWKCLRTRLILRFAHIFGHIFYL